MDAADLEYVALETFEDGLDSAIEGIVCVWSSPEVSWESVSELSEQALSQLQVFDGSKPWVWVTRDGVAAEDNDAVSGLSASALWGLARTARNENPDWQFSLVDGHVGLAKVLAHGEEPELALRGDVMLAPRLVRTQHDRLEFPQEGSWRIGILQKGQLDALSVETIEAAPLEAGQVRIQIEATGVNFRDVLNVLGMVETPAWTGACGHCFGSGGRCDHFGRGR